jgi:F-type H+-transporting ATPase subunit delta
LADAREARGHATSRRTNVANEESAVSGVAGRYATAVFELAQEQKSLDGVARDFSQLAQIIAEGPELALFVRSPIFSRDEHQKGMDAVLRRIEAQPLTVRFVLTLAQKRRLFALPEIIRSFDKLLANQRGEVDAEVTAARPLSEAQTAELKHVLKAKLGREARITTRIDPSLLGGLIVKVGSRMIDSSLRTKLEGLRVAMRGH